MYEPLMISFLVPCLVLLQTMVRMMLVAYSNVREAMCSQGIEHKENRSVHLGNHLTFLFEDEATIRYQIQEMLHIEKIFDEDGIQGELNVYLPLMPNGSNLKATMQI